MKAMLVIMTMVVRHTWRLSGGGNTMARSAAGSHSSPVRSFCNNNLFTFEEEKKEEISASGFQEQMFSRNGDECQNDNISHCNTQFMEEDSYCGAGGERCEESEEETGASPRYSAYFH